MKAQYVPSACTVEPVDGAPAADGLMRQQDTKIASYNPKVGLKVAAFRAWIPLCRRKRGNLRV